MAQHPTQVAVWVAVQTPPNERERRSKRGFNPLLDPLEQAVSWLVNAIFTPERREKWATRLGLPGVRRT